MRKVENVSDEQARWSPVPTGTSLIWLVSHLARAETLWIVGRFAGTEIDTSTFDPSDEGRETLADAVESYRATWKRVDAIVADADLDDVCKIIDVAPAPDLRWVLAHLLQETARHAGHADILRELIDGHTGR